jgi:hypothetical protein
MRILLWTGTLLFVSLFPLHAQPRVAIDLARVDETPSRFNRAQSSITFQPGRLYVRNASLEQMVVRASTRVR